MGEKDREGTAVAISRNHFEWLQKQGLAKEYCVLPLFFDDLRNDTVIALKEGLEEMVYRAYMLGYSSSDSEPDDEMTTPEYVAFALGVRNARLDGEIPTMEKLLLEVRVRIPFGQGKVGKSEEDLLGNPFPELKDI